MYRGPLRPDTENVTVVDASATSHQDLPYGEGEDDLSTSSVLELTFATERELENRLLGLLTPVLGPGNVVCQVRAVLNTDKVKITDRTYESEPPGILRSTQETSEMYQGTGAPPGGQAGALDVPSYHLWDKVNSNTSAQRCSGTTRSTKGLQRPDSPGTIAGSQLRLW